jgi:Fur family zinc uptake transcriptional regulator
MSDSSHHAHHDCIHEALTKAEALCRARGSRLTATRRRVLELVWQNHRAVKAYDLLSHLKAEDPSAKPPTIYRALDFLMEEGLIHRVESLNAFVGCNHPATEGSEPSSAHECQFFICEQCQEVTEFCTEALNRQLRQLAEASQFHVTRHTIELHGLCHRCYSAAAGEKASARHYHG